MSRLTTTNNIKLITILIALLSLFSAQSATSTQDEITIEFNKPGIAKTQVAIPDFVSSRPGSLNGRDLANILKNDLYLTGLFQVVEAPPQNPGGEPNLEAWAHTGAKVLITGQYEVAGDQVAVELRLYDLALKRMDLGKRYSGPAADHRRIVHKFGDRVMEKLTGTPGCFSSRIAYVGEGQSKELYCMDFDGHNTARLTNNGTINMSPEWAPDNKALIFTSYLNHNPDLWWLDLATLKQYPLSTRPGINASGRFSPDGGTIALSMSFKGIPKIYLINMQGNITNRLTQGRGDDISPTWSPDGTYIAYVSDQAGTPQIYTVPASGGEPRRLTMSGKYNTDPDWSPKGDLIAFTSRIEGRFQICVIKTDGTDFKVLTKVGSNQDPAWSPDGRMISFVSERDGKKQIYIMDVRGEIQVPVSRIPGKAPAWSRNFQ
jgi:TolB protein